VYIIERKSHPEYPSFFSFYSHHIASLLLCILRSPVSYYHSIFRSFSIFYIFIFIFTFSYYRCHEVHLRHHPHNPPPHHHHRCRPGGPIQRNTRAPRAQIAHRLRKELSHNTIRRRPGRHKHPPRRLCRRFNHGSRRNASQPNRL